MDPKQPNEKRNPDQQFPGGQKKQQQNPTEKPQRDQDQQRKY
jgi:hypothetical protein